MTTAPRRLAVKVRRLAWREEDHPRDRKGRFIETGAEVRVWGGIGGTVVRNVGGGRIEIKRNTDQQHIIVHRNYLTVVSRPGGGEPTSSRDDNPAALVESEASPLAIEADIPTVAPDVDTPAASENLYDALRDEDLGMAALVRQAAIDYQEALGNGTPDDEADERDGLLGVIDDAERQYGDTPGVPEAAAALRAAAAAEPGVSETSSGDVTAADLRAGDLVIDVDPLRPVFTTPTVVRDVEHYEIQGRRFVDIRTDTGWTTVDGSKPLLRLPKPAKPVYDGGNEPTGALDEQPIRDDRRDPLADTPASGVRDDPEPGDVLRGPGGRGADPGRRADGSGGDADRPDVRGSDQPAPSDPADRRGTRDPGGAADDTARAGDPGRDGPGVGGGADGVLRGAGRDADEAAPAGVVGVPDVAADLAALGVDSLDVPEAEEIVEERVGSSLLTGASVGTWTSTPDPTNEGVILVKGDYGIEGRMIRTLDGWRGTLYDGETTAAAEDPGDVLVGLYDAVNGEGAAARTRREYAAGRPLAPEVGLTWESLPTGSRIRLTPHETVNGTDEDGRWRQYVIPTDEAPRDVEFLRYWENRYQTGAPGNVAYRDPTMEYPNDGYDTMPVPREMRPVPAAPLLGEESTFLATVDDDPDYDLDPSAVPTRLDGPRFVPTGVDDLAPAGQMAKLDANLAALRTLRDLRAENRAATPGEQTVLARWAGWGGLAEVFDPDKTAFASRRAELESLLTASEMREARRNTLNAHYTDARVVQAVWDAVEGLGFNGGRVLEPGSGSGTFIGFAPEGAAMVGVELDSTTAAISKYLYPDAQIRNESFADTNLPDGAFDATVGNVPFGRFALQDRLHNPDGESIHNHFILKSLDFTRPGGLVAVLTSRYTLDAENDTARQKMYAQADLVGAVRLPNGSHQRASGTDVIEDVLIFRKRLDGEEPGDGTWLASTKRDLNGWNVAVNGYFDVNPSHALGELTAEKGQFGGEVRVHGDRDMPDLTGTLNGIVETAREAGLTATPSDPDLPDLISPDTTRHEGHIQVEEDGSFTQAQSGASIPLTVPPRQRAELAALVGLRDTLTRLLDAEAATGDDTEEITSLRDDLNTRYDQYVTTYGPINRFRWSKSGSRLRDPQGGFRSDPMSSVVQALENYEPPAKGDPGATGSATKAPIFTTRAVAPRALRTTADTPADALTLSMDTYGEVNLPAVARMLGTDETSAREQLGNLVFEVPPLSDEEQVEAEQAALAVDADPLATHLGDLAIGRDRIQTEPGRLVPAAEYLSGNVRKKMAAARVAAEADPRYTANVDALRGVIPRDLSPEEIDVRLGASWIDAKTVEDFLNDTLRLYGTNKAKVAHSGGAIWSVVAPHWGAASDTWGTQKRPMGTLVQAMLEQRSITVTTDGGQDIDATLAAQEKAELIQERFSEWVWEDPARARKLTARYNDQFNAIALRAYDGSGRTFQGVSEDWVQKVQPHVKDAVERIVNEPTALLAHVVGAGKTAEMVLGSGELRRLGLARKPAVVVPNHMLEQFTREYLEIYPNAKVHTAGQGMTAEERRRFVARAATGDWDIVILTQGAFESIPMSRREQEAYLTQEMQDLRDQLAAITAASDGSAAAKRTVKKIESAILRAENALKKKLGKVKDVGVTFEQTGIDYLMVDEAHMYSNLRTLSHIEGASATGSDKATDLHMKMQYLRANSKSGRVATFATGTPIRNTVTQAYVMQRFLRPDLLEEAGIHGFDQWAGTFGSVVSEMELKPEGTGFRQTSRFAKFRNVPEFLRMFHTFADVKMADDLNLPRPNLAGGQAETVSVPRTDQLAAFIRELGDRADKVRSGQIDPRVDNMLKISTDGRKAALSMRLIGGDHEPGKIEAAADRIASIYDANKDKVFADPKTGEPDPAPGALQIVFADMGTPKGAKMTAAERLDAGETESSADEDSDSGWNAYDFLKAELVARGVPEDQIRYVHEAKNDAEKAELFAAARAGRISVLVGSSEKMGVGTNMQRRAKALHHIDAPWRPADVEQRDGRIQRQGNLHMNMGEDVQIIRYVTEGSFDAYMWQTLERKAKFINQIMRGSIDVREIEDVGDTAMSYAEVKAIATGNPDLLDKAKADTAVTKLQRLERSHTRTQATARQEIGRLTQQADILEANAVVLDQAAADRVEPYTGTSVDGESFETRVALGTAFAERLEAIRVDTRWGDGEPESVGTFGGFPVTAQSIIDSRRNRCVAITVGGLPVEVSRFYAGEVNALGVVQRLENFLDSLPSRRDSAVATAARNRVEVARMTDLLGRTFSQQAALEAWTRRADRLAEKITRDEQREKGVDVPFDPYIDSDQFDDPLTKDRANTPPPESAPARVEVTAAALNVGARVEFILGEVSGTAAHGVITKISRAAGMVFITIKGDDGKEYTRALAPETVMVKVGDATSPVGVKGFLATRVLTMVDGRVVVEVKRASRWREDLHPRDRRGRFIETFAEVRIWGGGSGRVTGMAGGGRVKVRRTDGIEIIVDAGNVEVVRTASGEDVGSSQAPSTPPTPDPSTAPSVTPPTGETDADPDTSPAPDATQEAATAVFTAESGARAWLNVEDGQPVGYVQTDPDDPDTIRRYNDASVWAEDVDAEAMSEDFEGGTAAQALAPSGSLADGAPDTPDAPSPALEPPTARRSGESPEADTPEALKAAEVAAMRARAEDLRNIDLGSAKPVEAVDLRGPLGDAANDFAGGSAAQHLTDGPDGTKTFSPERADLHARIVAHILDSYDSQEAPKFNVLGGGPAAGKSTMERALPEISDGNALINADEIKAMLPEYADRVDAGDPTAAGFVHEESSYLAKVVQAEAFGRKVSVTLDGTGDSGASKMIAKIKAAKAAGYAVNGYYVTAETEEAVRRATARAAKTGRGVPETVIRETHKTVSAIFEAITPEFDSLVLMDTQAPPGPDGKPGMVMLKEPGGNVQIIDADLYEKFLAKANE